MNKIFLPLGLLCLFIFSCENEELCKKSSDCNGFCKAYENTDEVAECVKGSCICKGKVPDTPNPNPQLCEEDAECLALCQTSLSSVEALCIEKSCYCQFNKPSTSCSNATECSALCQVHANTKDTRCTQSQCYCLYVQSTDTP